MLDNALTQLEVEHVQNVLLDDILKGAIFPHPQRLDYDLKVIDKQAAIDPARYFTEGFLGCLTKKSDEHQVKRLIPELRDYAAQRGLPFAVERLPELVAGLQANRMTITGRIITEAVRHYELFGTDFQSEDFLSFINRESTLGTLDIPSGRFNRRGATKKVSRKLSFHFRDPDYRGVTLSGPPAAISKILVNEGDTTTFRIQTTKDGYDIRYE